MRLRARFGARPPRAGALSGLASTSLAGLLASTSIRALLVATALAALLASGACSGSGSAAPGERAVTLLYTADAQGYLEECACSTGGELGGIARRAALVDSLRAGDPDALLVEAGDFAGGPGPQGELVGYVAAQAMKRMRYDAVLPGEVELNLGPDFWKKVAPLGLPIVHTNFGTPELGPPDPEPLVVEKGGRRIAFLGLVGPDMYFLPATRDRVQVTPPLAAAGAALGRLEGCDVDLVVGLVHMRQAEVDSLTARFPRLDVVVAGHTSKDSARPETRGSAVYVTGGFLGQHLGRLTLAGPELDAAEGSSIRIETSMPEDPQIARWVGIAAPK